MYSTEKELTILKKGLEELDITYSESQFQQFQRYLEILYSYENRLHLISHTDYRRISLKHFLPSLLIWKSIGNDRYACDIGAGAGFPSVPIKILKPDIDFTLFESIKKKARFLESLIEYLNLSGIRVNAGRAEEYTGLRFDLVLVRAAGKIGDLIEIIDRVIASDGRAVFYKTVAVEQEIENAKEKLDKKHFAVEIRKVFTPLENIPMALVFLKREE